MMLDDDCSIMNEVINKPPPPPPPPEGQDKRGQQGNKRDSNNRDRDSNSRNQRRKEGNGRFQNKNRKPNDYDYKQSNFNSHQPSYPGPPMPQQPYNPPDGQQYMPSSSHSMPGPQFPNPPGQNVMTPWMNPQSSTPGPMPPSMPGPPMQGPYPHPSMQDQNQMQGPYPPMGPMQGGPPMSGGQPPIPGQTNMNGPPCPPMAGPQAMPPGMQMQGPPMPGPPGETPPGPMPGMGGGGYSMGMMDPSMMAAWGMMGPDGQPVKAPITYSKCVLYPPNPSAPKPTTRERPPGCRTIFVGGLPENSDEEIIRDVFDKCGEIQTIRVSKKNFCHIRYGAEFCVDNAIYLSGWRMRINNEADAPNTGRLHVDFAQARDDHYEWECNVRALQREERHRTRVMEDMMRPPSPPPIPHFSDHEAHTVAEDIKKEDAFSKSVEILLTWLERGECSKRNAPSFFTMIQAVNSHVRRLMGEQATHEADLQRMKEEYKSKVQTILTQFGQIETVFSAAGHQKVWDHFTKAQRKNITTWKKQAADVRSLQLAGALNETEDVAMDLSDDEKEDKDTDSDSLAGKKRKIDTEKLREESEEWACQAMGYRNEVESIKADMITEVENKDKQIKILQQTLQGMQQQLIEAQKKKNDLPAFLMSSEEKKTQEKIPEKIKDNAILEGAHTTEAETSKAEVVIVPLAGKHAKIVGIVSSFLNVHPFGASMDYIWSYLLKIDATLGLAEVENVLQQYPDCFELKLTGVGASIERKWMFVAFQDK